MVARTFDMDREVQKALLQIQKQNRRDDRETANAAETEPERRAIRKALREQRATEEPARLERARELALEREKQFKRGQAWAAHKRQRLAEQEAEYAAERAEEKAKALAKQAVEAEQRALDASDYLHRVTRRNA